MNEQDLKERNFEADIERWLLENGGYKRGNQKTYDMERAIDLATLTAFLDPTQLNQWDRSVR